MSSMPSYVCSFARGAWDAADWLPVKRADWDHYGQWRQADDCIENMTPAVTDPAALAWKEEEGIPAGDTLISRTHASMVYARLVTGDFTVAATLAFADRMAPSIVLGTLTDSARPTHKQYRESYEIVLWDNGINIWRQSLPEGRVEWTLLAFLTFTCLPDTRYTLRVCREGDTLHLQVADHLFGLLVTTLPASCYVGITGCEGVNRFYDFQLTPAQRGMATP